MTPQEFCDKWFMSIGTAGVADFVSALEHQSIAVQSTAVQAEREAHKSAYNLLERTMPILEDDIMAYGDDHSVGICCCDIINLADDISAAIRARNGAREETKE